jgi:predicted metallo-beta-lactamase superfamily hydrolase
LRIEDELLEANRKELFKTHPTKATSEEDIAKFIGEK